MALRRFGKIKPDTCDFVSEIFHLRNEAEPFFLNIFKNAKAGSLFLFVDNSTAKFPDWFDSLIKRSPIDVIESRSVKMKIDDTSEEKSDLGKYWSKFRHPKLTADIAYRICRKQAG